MSLTTATQSLYTHVQTSMHRFAVHPFCHACERSERFDPFKGASAVHLAALWADVDSRIYHNSCYVALLALLKLL